MILQRAIYGHDRGGHAFLRGSSPELKTTFSAITWRTDLPATAPYGVSWTAYLRGFADSGNYVLVRIAPDPSAPRAGMVFSHAVFIPLERLSDPLDFKKLFSQLSVTPDRNRELDPIEVSERLDDGQVSGAALSIVEMLASSPKQPVVHVGQEDFDESVVQILQRLPAKIKKNFAFRLSFGPQDVEHDPQHVVATPNLLETRWHGHPIVRGELVAKPGSVAGFLLGLDCGRALRTFVDSIGAEVSDFKSVALLSNAFALSEKPSPSIEELVALVRLLPLLAPRDQDGVDFKVRLVARLAESVAIMTADQLRSLRNLDLSPYADRQRCWSAISEWTSSHAAKIGDNDDVPRVLLDAFTLAAVSEWKQAVLKGFRDASSNLSASMATALWRVFGNNPEAASAALALLPSVASVERRLREAMPGAVDPDLAASVIAFAKERAWWILHGRCLAVSTDPQTALEAQLEVDGATDSIDGIAAALSQAAPVERLRLALSHEDRRLISVAGAECALAPELLGNFDAANPRWLAILQVAVERSPDALQHVPSGRGVVEALLQFSGQADEYASLWNVLAKSPFSNLYDVPQRREIWHQIPAFVRAEFLASTAETWLAAQESGHQTETSVEPALEERIIEPVRISAFLVRAIPARIAEGVQLFRQFPRLDENRFIEWLAEIDARMKYGGLEEDAARALGLLVDSRFWTRAAYRIRELTRRRRDMKPALLACRYRLYPLDILNLSVFGIEDVPEPGEDELWRILEDIVVGLYPRGPDENEIWSRASGSPDVLSHSGNSRARWHSALRRLRSGGGGITPARLVAEMRDEFPLNKELESIAACSIFREVGSE
ncbi:hypothetical protein HNQ36_002773 [Afipia massiliensis]|uniref:Effector-associated domain-containing protein n=1 Tax=Afipia massiliensis TaxID=211460 RepID=A0A840MWV2_9BRAD|nr:effector-associated domain EAD1-containing protein [Afipia massiliensis]MBB5052799.1 hypothetical protein [Afipia massiliensis]